MRVKRSQVLRSSAWNPHDKYQEDPRWEKAKELAKQGKFAECADLVYRINKEYGASYR